MPHPSINRAAPVLALLVALTGCGSDPAPAAQASAAPVAAAASAAAPARAPDAGNWQMSQSEAAASARYISPEGKVLLALTCDLPTKVVSLAVSNAQAGNQTFVLQAAGQAARLDTIADNNAADPHQMAAIALNAPVFVGFIQSGGTIEVSQPGLSSVLVPSDTGIRSVFEACQ